VLSVPSCKLKVLGLKMSAGETVLALYIGWPIWYSGWFDFANADSVG